MAVENNLMTRYALRFNKVTKSKVADFFWTPAKNAEALRYMKYQIYNPKNASENDAETIHAIQCLKSGPAYRINDVPVDVPDGTVFSVEVEGEIRHVGRSGNSRAQVERIGMPLNPAMPVNHRTKAHVALKWTRQILNSRVTYDGGSESKEAMFANPSAVALLKSLQERIAGKGLVRFVRVDNATHRKLLRTWAEDRLGGNYNEPR